MILFMSLVDPPLEAIPSRAELRKLLDALLVSDSELNGFVFEHFPSVLKLFRPGLERSVKLDLLLDHAEASELQRRLRERGVHGRKRRPSEVFDFTGERGRHVDLFGCADVLETLDGAARKGGWVILSGAPGVGKTALMSALLQRIEQRTRRPVPHHFLRRTVTDTTRPGAVLRSLAAQIEAQFPQFTDADAPPELRLIDLIKRVANRALKPEDRLILLVDGLDEAETEGKSNPLPRFLPPELPPNVTLVCSLRSSYPHFGWLMDQARRHGGTRLALHLDLDAPPWNQSTDDACALLWAHHGARLGLAAELSRRAAQAADGNMLHAVKLHEHIEDLHARGLPLPTPDELPIGLRALLQRLWDALPGDARAALGMLCATRQSLPLSQLVEMLGWPDDSYLAEFVRAARLFLLIEPAPTAASIQDDCARFSHLALREFVEAQLGPTALHQSHRQLAAGLCMWPPLEDHLYGFRRLYALRHAITQHIETDAVSFTSQVIGNVDYLIAKCQEQGSAALAEDLEHAAARCKQPEAARTFSALAQALRVAAHWLAQDPSALPGLLYNLLRCMSWTEAAIERVLHFPPQRLRFRLRHPLQRRDTSVHTFAGHWDSVVACALTQGAPLTAPPVNVSSPSLPGMVPSRRLVSVSLDHTVRLWDLNSGALLMHFYGFAGAASAFALTPDGNQLLYAAEDHALVLYDVHTGALLRRLRGHGAPICVCVITPDGRKAVTAAENLLKVWDLATGEELHTLSGHRGQPSVVRVTPDGRHLVSAGWDHTLRIWDLSSGRPERTLSEHRGAISAFVLLRDGKQVISASWDHSLRLWNTSSGARIQLFVGHSAPVNACAVTPDGKLLISGSDDHSLKIWEISSGRELRSLQGHTGPVKGCALSADGKTIISHSDDCTLRQWDVQTGAPLGAFVGHQAPVLSCVVAPDGRQLLSASEDKTLKLWDMRSAIELDSSKSSGHTDAIGACWFTPDGTGVVTASDDQTLKLWDLATGAVVRTLSGHSDAVSACVLTPDGNKIISASPDRTVVIWDVATGGEVLSFSTEASPSREFVVHAGGSHLAFPSDDHMIELWGMPLESQSPQDTAAGRVRGCAITPDGRHLITAAGDRLLRLWDLGTGAELARFTGHAGAVNACVVMPDGRRLISGSSDKQLILWDMSAGAELQRFTGHTGAVNACAVSADGKRLLSGSHDRTLRLWDTQTGLEQLRLTGHAAPVSACVFSSDGRRAVSASLDYTLKVWELQSGMCVETIYGSSAFLCVSLSARGDWLCAGDQAGNVWMLRDQVSPQPQVDPRMPRQSLVDSLRRLLRR